MAPRSPDILERFLGEAAPAARFDVEGGAVLALSGGPDSTALLDLVLRAGAPPDLVVAAHLDHTMRPDSREDAAFVADQARAAGIRCRMRRRNLPAEAAGENLEQVARDRRYEFLESVARREGLTRVVTGHHLDDQAETVMLRLIRGTGPDGLRSIPPSRPIREGSSIRLVRPLLPFRKEEIVAYLAWRGLPYRIDRTNLDGTNARSRIRTRLLPGLAREVPDLAARLAALADRARGLPRPADPVTPAGLRRALKSELPADGPVIDRRTMERLEGILAAGRGSTDLGSGWQATVEKGRLVVIPPVGERDGEAVELGLPGTCTLPDGTVLRAEPAEEEARPNEDSGQELVDARTVREPLTVRPAAMDGAFRPLGMGRETTVLRFLKGQGVPKRIRERVPVVWSDGIPVWVVGYRIDERAAVGDETASMVWLRRTSPRPLPPR